MEIVMHLGAHRTGSTTFQAYMRENRSVLTRNGITFWGPAVTRKGLFSGLSPQRNARGELQANHKRAEGRVMLKLDQEIASGARTLVVSEENIIGSVRDCVREGELYPALGERAVRFGRAFGGRINKIVLCIRSQETFWPSAMAMVVERGMPVPARRKRANIATSSRSWRHVITDLARALPEADLRVLPFEDYAANPRRVLEEICGYGLPTGEDYGWLNRAPDLDTLRDALRERGQDTTQLPEGSGPWHPFDADQCAKLQESYADDLFWLAAGADGLATMTEEIRPERRENAQTPAETRGHEDDKEGRLDKAS